MIWRTFQKEVLAINPKLIDPFHFKVCDKGKVYFIFSAQGSNKVLLVLLSVPARLCITDILKLSFAKKTSRDCFLKAD